VTGRTTSASVLALTVLVLSTGCGSGNGSGHRSGPVVVSTPNPNGCTKPPPLQRKHLTFAKEPPLTIARTTYTARVVTNCGTIIVSLDGRHAPHTVNSLAFLSRKGYFDDTPCHRLTTSRSYVLQCGDPTGTGTGGPGYTLPQENLTNAAYPAGTVAMANSSGSQFVFVYADTAMPSQGTPFGKVTAGLDVIRQIAKAGSTPPGDGRPNQPVVIESVGVTRG
jgi:peptidyl-prolyl cis-trans isomerase B (cyclophilin B)